MNKTLTREEFYKELHEVAKRAYDKDFYNWLGHWVEYLHDIAVFVDENDNQPDGTLRRTPELLSMGADFGRYYWQRRETDKRDPDLWLPVGYHGTAHTCHILPKREGECKICKKIELHNAKNKEDTI